MLNPFQIWRPRTRKKEKRKQWRNPIWRVRFLQRVSRQLYVKYTGTMVYPHLKSEGRILGQLMVATLVFFCEIKPRKIPMIKVLAGAAAVSKTNLKKLLRLQCPASGLLWGFFRVRFKQLPGSLSTRKLIWEFKHSTIWRMLPLYPTKGEVRKSFLDHYIQIIEEKLPQILHPNNEKHGTHSYTKYLGWFWGVLHVTALRVFKGSQKVLYDLNLRHLGKARVEVILRQQAFKPKATLSGTPLKESSNPA